MNNSDGRANLRTSSVVLTTGYDGRLRSRMPTYSKAKRNIKPKAVQKIKNLECMAFVLYKQLIFNYLLYIIL